MIPFNQSPSISAFSGIKHGFFSKSGGVSSGIYTSLNCGPSSDDELDNVIENRGRALSALGLSNAKLFGLQQIHSTHVYTLDGNSTEDFQKGDGLVTRETNIALSVLGADCAPLLFADNKAGIVGAAHAGWRGAVTGMVESMVSSMLELGATRENIHACIGPTIHQESYEVRDDFIQQLQSMSDFDTDEFLHKRNQQIFFDLPSYILKQFARSEINGESLGIDTYAHSDEYFSFRRNTHEGIKDYGRQISLICLS